MEARSPARTNDAEAIQRGIKNVASEHIGIQRRAVILAEDEIVLAAVIRVLFLHHQRAEKRGAEVDPPHAALGLWSNQFAFPECLPDFQRLRPKTIQG